MKKICPFFLLFLTSFLSAKYQAQTVSPQIRHQVDSLKRELKLAKHDTSRVKILYKIGIRVCPNKKTYWDSLLLLSIKYNMPKYQCRTLNNIAFISHTQNDLKNAMRCCLKGIEIAEKNGFEHELLLLYVGAFTCYDSQNDTKRSLEYTYKLLKIAEKLKDSSFVEVAYSNLSRLLLFMEEYDKALKVSLDALRKARKLNNPQLIARSLLAVGANYSLQKKHANSINYYRQSKKYLTQVDSYCTIEIYNALGSAFDQEYLMNPQEKSALSDSAYNLYSKSYEIAKSINDNNRIVSSLSLLANNNLRKGNIELAEKQANEGLSLARKISFHEEISRAGLLLKKIYEKTGRYKEALRAHELYVSVKDSLANDNNRKVAMQKEFDYEFEKKENENKLLAQQNQIQFLKLNQNKYLVIGLSTILLLVLLFSILLFRQNKIRTNQKTLQLEQKLLLAQMNPHFIFNSLQAIQNFILKNNKQDADSFLSSFALVMRHVLENSRVESIPLKKEIDLLKNYLRLQQLRFKNRFEYEIKVDEAIDVENTLIPPMLAQPFIENAVEHGFYGLESGGKIEISYFVNDNTLLMSISDNGLGMKDNYQASKQHRSLALEITKDRVTLINNKAKQKASFKIGEAFPLQSERKGVRIDFVLPFQLLT